MKLLAELTARRTDTLSFFVKKLVFITFQKQIANKTQKSVSYNNVTKSKTDIREVIYNEQKRSTFYGTEDPYTIYGKNTLGA